MIRKAYRTQTGSQPLAAEPVALRPLVPVGRSDGVRPRGMAEKEIEPDPAHIRYLRNVRGMAENSETLCPIPTRLSMPRIRQSCQRSTRTALFDPSLRCYSSRYSLTRVFGAFCVGWCRATSLDESRQITASI